MRTYRRLLENIEECKENTEDFNKSSYDATPPCWLGGRAIALIPNAFGNDVVDVAAVVVSAIRAHVLVVVVSKHMVVSGGGEVDPRRGLVIGVKYVVVRRPRVLWVLRAPPRTTRPEGQ